MAFDTEGPLPSDRPRLQQLGLQGFFPDSAAEVEQDGRKNVRLGARDPQETKEKIEELDYGSRKQAAPPRQLAPMLQQYVNLKKEYPEHVLLFQVGDFYEVFFDDARIVSDALNIRLTSRDKDASDPVPMCGVPIHAIDNYLPRLLEQGYSCVLMSQVEEGGSKKGMVRREITRIITPGVRFEGDGLNEKRFNYLAAVCVSAGEVGAVSYVDVSTGHLRVQGAETLDELLEVIKRVHPAEVILPSTLFSMPVPRGEEWLREVKILLREMGSRIVQRPFDRAVRSEVLGMIQTLLASGKEQVAPALEQLSPSAVASLRSVLDYVQEVSFGRTPQLAQFSVEEGRRAVFIDAATRRNLELTETRLDGERRNSLLGHIDYARTAMGSRLLTEWILSPSCSREEILRRLDSVEELKNNMEKVEQLRSRFLAVRDLDRLLSRITGLRATARDLCSLSESLEQLPEIKRLVSDFSSSMLLEISSNFEVLEDVAERLRNALAEDPPVRINEGGIFRDGYDEQIDRLRSIRREGRSWLADLEEREKKATGISGLRVKYNNVFGYFIEVSKTHLRKIPDYFERRQTLANAERFVTQELKEYEASILTAKAKQCDLERELFSELRLWVAEQAARVQAVSRELSLLDVLCSFAHLSAQHNYNRPEILDDGALVIVGGRHPVVERVLGSHNFIPNDTTLDTLERRFAVLTGPNMGGKSTYLRQIGLIQLLAQAGSFVPAETAKLSVVDRIFTRIGAADNLSRGDSTFMVEMREAAVILRRATAKSLVLIDEIGRGTATTDGLALATAISEWLHDRIGCKTVFATHFHQLTHLEGKKQGAFCLSVGVIERDKEIIFTHRIEARAADRSYGIEVARLAGLPEGLLERAEQVLFLLDEENCNEEVRSVFERELAGDSSAKEYLHGGLLPLAERLSELNPDKMTPLQALCELVELRQIALANK